MSIEENKALVRRFVEAVNKGDEAALAQIVADDFTASTLAADIKFDRKDLVGLFVGRLQVIPDFRSTIIDLIAEGDKVVALGRDTGTPTGEYMGIPPTGKSFNMTWVDVYRIRKGQLVEMLVEANLDTMRQQLAG